MKLKSQFLSLSALLAMGMATTAWAAEVNLATDANGIKYVNMPQTGTDELLIPDGVSVFNVYDYAGADGDIDVPGSEEKSYILLTAPEGYKLRVSGELIRGLQSGNSTAVQSYLNIYDGTNTDANRLVKSEFTVAPAGGSESVPTNMTSGRNLLVYLRTRPTSGTLSSPGLNLTIEVLFANAIINQSGTTTNTHTLADGKKKFEVQVPAGVGNIDNTSTFVAPEGYVLYMPDAATPNGGSMTVEGNLSSSMTVHVATTNDGFASDLNALVHVVKKTTSTTAIDIYTQDDNSYAVAKITDGVYNGAGAVSIPSAVNVDDIIYDRVFTAGTAGTIVLPFSLPSSATTNAKFYYLKNVLQVEGYCKWKATFRNINLINVTLPADNTPYAVIVPEAELKFNLNGGRATFQTKTIADQVENDGNENWIFKGTYQYKLWGANDPEVGLAYALAAEDGSNYTAGQYVKVGNGAYAVPMRAYVRKVNSSVELEPLGRPLAKGEVSSIENLPEVIDAEFVDENEKTTAIGRLNTVTGAIKIDRWFDLKGRSTNHKPTTKGAFFNKKGIAK